jgi:hypothetical protein
VSGVTPHLSSQVIYDRPNVPSGSLASTSILTVSELTRGLRFNTRRPSSLLSIMSLRRGRAGPAVVSPKADIMSGEYDEREMKRD